MLPGMPVCSPDGLGRQPYPRQPLAVHWHSAAELQRPSQVCTVFCEVALAWSRMLIPRCSRRLSVQTGSLLADSLQSQEEELSNAQINRAIGRAHCSTAVLDLVCEHGHKFNQINAAKAVHQVAKHRPQDLRAVLGHAGWQRLLQVVSSNVDRFKPRHVSNTLWALGALGQKPEQLLAQLLSALPSTLSKGNAQVVSNALWGVAALQIHPGRRLLLAAEKRALRVLPSATSQAVSNVVWSFATLEHRPSDQLLTSAAQRFVEVVHTATQQIVADLLWSYATQEHRPSDQLLTAAAQQFVPVVASTQVGHFAMGEQPAVLLARLCLHGWGLATLQSPCPGSGLLTVPHWSIPPG